MDAQITSKAKRLAHICDAWYGWGSRVRGVRLPRQRALRNVSTPTVGTSGPEGRVHTYAELTENIPPHCHTSRILATASVDGRDGACVLRKFGSRVASESAIDVLIAAIRYMTATS